MVGRGSGRVHVTGFNLDPNHRRLEDLAPGTVPSGRQTLWMTEMKSVPPNRALPVIRTLLDGPWPIGEATVPRLAARVGWVVKDIAGHLVVADSGYGLSRPEVTLSSDNGELTQISFNVTDAFVEDVPGRSNFMRDEFAQYVRALSGEFGKPVRRTAGANPSCVWDLPNGSRLRIGNIQMVVTVTVTSPEYAAVRRELGG